ncbi:MAG: thiamine-phosphate kinase [Neisseria sp.]|nr:thiamine-phosphate kinase [Neisseria sp.]
MKELDFIKTYLKNMPSDNSVVLGIGDDAAIVRPRAGFDLCMSSDMLVAGRHFFADVAPDLLAHKVVAVNVSDMAAMGAKPRWIMLSVALPQLDKTWLDAFCAALFRVCREHQISLIGGDTTRGEQAVFNVSIIGEVPTGQGLRRSNAQIGDDVWVSGRLGLAAAALKHHLGEWALPDEWLAECEHALHLPEPRVALGQGLLNLANAAQDVSDGLLQDLGHIAKASGVAARLDLLKIPTLPELKTSMPSALWQECVLAGGDDYELLFTASADKHNQIIELGKQLNLSLSKIGTIEQGSGVRVFDENQQEIFLNKQGFDHFGND